LPQYIASYLCKPAAYNCYGNDAPFPVLPQSPISLAALLNDMKQKVIITVVPLGLGWQKLFTRDGYSSHLGAAVLIIKQRNKWQSEPADNDRIGLSWCGDIRFPHVQGKLHRSPARNGLCGAA